MVTSRLPVSATLIAPEDHNIEIVALLIEMGLFARQTIRSPVTREIVLTQARLERGQGFKGKLSIEIPIAAQIQYL
jgi:hypothetical protein